MSNLTYYDFNAVSWLWGFFQSAGITPNGLAGLFGNLYQESHCCPYELEGWEYDLNLCWDYTVRNIRTTQTALQFANQIYGNAGGRQGKGFGLAQWTEQSRKVNLWNYVMGQPPSGWDGSTHNMLGDMERDANFLLWELQNDTTSTSVSESFWSAQGHNTWWWLTNPNATVEDCVCAVLLLFEIPFEQWNPPHSQVQTEFDLRQGYAYDTREDFSGVEPPPTPPQPPTPPTMNIPAYILFKLGSRDEKFIKGKVYNYDDDTN